VSRPRSPAPAPKRPFRDTVIFYAVLSVIIVGVAALTGGNVATAAAVAGGVFLVATAWSWWRLSKRAERESQR
jgi:Flp pilus assembly protein TadB